LSFIGSEEGKEPSQGFSPIEAVLADVGIFRKGAFAFGTEAAMLGDADGESCFEARELFGSRGKLGGSPRGCPEKFHHISLIYRGNGACIHQFLVGEMGELIKGIACDGYRRRLRIRGLFYAQDLRPCRDKPGLSVLSLGVYVGFHYVERGLSFRRS
jgi:hypothetical protein